MRSGKTSCAMVSCANIVRVLGLLARGVYMMCFCQGFNHVPSSCLAEGIQLSVERLGALFSLCRQAAWWPGARCWMVPSN